MSLLSVTEYTPGFVGTAPVVIQVDTTDTYATVTTTGYLNGAKALGSTFSDHQMALVYTSDDGVIWLQVAIDTSGNVSLQLPESPGEVTLPTITNHIIVSTNTTGTLANLTGVAINNGSIQAGLSGTAGTLISYPATASKGSFIVAGVANTGDTTTTLSNVAMGQASVVSIPDPANAVGRLLVAASATPFVSGNLVKASGTGGLVVDAGARILSGTTGSYAGGGTSNAFTVTGLTSAAVGSCVIRTSTNASSIAKAVPGTNILTVTFSADPGATTTVDYIYTTAGQT